MEFNTGTLAFALAYASLLLFLIMLVESRVVRIYKGLDWWTAGNLALTVGFVCNLLRESPSIRPAAIIANNLFFLLSMMLFHVGLRIYLGKPPRLILHALWVLEGAGIAAVFTLAVDNLAVRRINLSLNLCAITLAIAHSFWKERKRDGCPTYRMLGIVYLLQGGFWLLRGLSAFQTSAELVTESPWTTATYVVELGAAMLTTFGFILLLNQRLAGENGQDRVTLERVFNVGPDAVMITRLADGRCVRVNEGFKAITGFAQDEVLGRTTVELGIWSAEVRERVIRPLKEEGSCDEVEIVFRRKDGSTFVALFSARIIQLDGEPHIISFTRDVSERKLAEEKIQLLVEQLESEKGSAERDALTDSLTGLANRRQFDETLRREFYRLNRGNMPLSMIMVDVDYFKKYNDHYGHIAGDGCLQQIAGILKESARRVPDLAARYGGEEFAVILPETEPAGALTVAEGIRRAIEALRIPHGESTIANRVTISLGVVTAYPEDAKQVTDFISLADQALYRAKQGGRNRVEIALTSATNRQDGIDRHPGLVRLVWNDSYECGDETIDAQHRLLYSLANELLSAVLRDQPKVICDSLINSLMVEIVRHFADEERILAEARYPELEKHRQLHATLTAHAGAIVERYERNEEILGELFIFLAHDVVAVHMMKDDLLYFQLLKEGRRAGHSVS